jgi:uncharacterized membrane protein YgcG
MARAGGSLPSLAALSLEPTPDVDASPGSAFTYDERDSGGDLNGRVQAVLEAKRWSVTRVDLYHKELRPIDAFKDDIRKLARGDTTAVETKPSLQAVDANEVATYAAQLAMVRFGLGKRTDVGRAFDLKGSKALSHQLYDLLQESFDTRYRLGVQMPTVNPYILNVDNFRNALKTNAQQVAEALPMSTRERRQGMALQSLSVTVKNGRLNGLMNLRAYDRDTQGWAALFTENGNYQLTVAESQLCNGIVFAQEQDMESVFMEDWESLMETFKAMDVGVDNVRTLLQVQIAFFKASRTSQGVQATNELSRYLTWMLGGAVQLVNQTFYDVRKATPVGMFIELLKDAAEYARTKYFVVLPLTAMLLRRSPWTFVATGGTVAVGVLSKTLTYLWYAWKAKEEKQMAVQMAKEKRKEDSQRRGSWTSAWKNYEAVAKSTKTGPETMVTLSQKYIDAYTGGPPPQPGANRRRGGGRGRGRGGGNDDDSEDDDDDGDDGGRGGDGSSAAAATATAATAAAAAATAAAYAATAAVRLAENATSGGGGGGGGGGDGGGGDGGGGGGSNAKNKRTTGSKDTRKRRR